MVVPITFKENTIVVIDTGRRNIYAGRGLHDFIQLPSVTLQARVGLRKSELSRLRMEGMDASSSLHEQALPPKGLRPSHYLVGRQLDQALVDGEAIEVYWPFAEGKIADWVQAEALWKYLLFQSIQLRRTLNEFPVLLSFPKALSVDSYQRLAQLFFERFNVAAFSVFDRPVMQIFAANATYGIVVDIDEYTTDVSCVWDGTVLNGGSIAIPIGLADCERYLTSLFMSNPSLLASLSPKEGLSAEDLLATVQRFTTFLWTEGHVKPPSSAGVVVADLVRGDEDPDSGANLAAIIVQGKEKALIEANSKKKGAAAARDAAEREREKERAALDLLDVEFEGKKVTVGKERHRMCDPLLDLGYVRNLIAEGEKHELTSMTIQEAVHLATSRLEWSASGVEAIKRSAVWEAVQVTGKMTRMRTLGPALMSYLQPYLTRDPAEYGVGANGQPVSTDQPLSSKYVRVPEYFANYRERGDEFAAYLGANIVAKLTFNDPTGRFLSKTDYSTKGPAAMSEIL